jgi:hypothetical protein
MNPYSVRAFPLFEKETASPLAEVIPGGRTLVMVVP